jgi:hypothetical protein
MLSVAISYLLYECVIAFRLEGRRFRATLTTFAWLKGAGLLVRDDTYYMVMLCLEYLGIWQHRPVYANSGPGLSAEKEILYKMCDSERTTERHEQPQKHPKGSPGEGTTPNSIPNNKFPHTNFIEV